MAELEPGEAADIARFEEMQKQPGHTHLFVVERSKTSLASDEGRPATLSREAVEDMGRTASGWMMSRAGRAIQSGYRPRQITMMLTVALGDDIVPDDGQAHVLADDEPLKALKDVEGHSIVVVVERPPPDLPQEELARRADATVEHLESVTCMWIMSRIMRAWPSKGPAHKVRMAVCALLDGTPPDDPEHLLGSRSLPPVDGGRRYD